MVALPLRTLCQKCLLHESIKRKALYIADLDMTLCKEHFDAHMAIRKKARTLKASMPTLVCLFCGRKTDQLVYHDLTDKWVCEWCFMKDDEVQREAARDS